MSERVKLDLRRNPHPGFGVVVLYGDDEAVISDTTGNIRSYAYERRAAQEPDKKWRLEVIGPLLQVTYWREGSKRWYGVKTGDGFA